MITAVKPHSCNWPRIPKLCQDLMVTLTLGLRIFIVCNLNGDRLIYSDYEKICRGIHLRDEKWEKMSTLVIIFKKENAPEIANCKTILISISICIFCVYWKIKPNKHNFKLCIFLKIFQNMGQWRKRLYLY